MGIAVAGVEVRTGGGITRTGDGGGSEEMAGVFDVAETAELAGETDG